MKSKFLVTASLFLLNYISSFGQEKIWTTQSKVGDVIAFEKQINPNAKFLNQSVSLSQDYYPLLDKYPVANPVIVQREALFYLPIYAEYYFSPSDSTLRLLSYDWEKDRYGNYFDKQKMWKEEAKKLETYNSEYERIKKMLSVQLGTPTETDSAVKTVTYEGGKYFTRKTLWETENVHAELNMIFESITYRIRLTLYWKK